jgi:hypothetical protein
MLCTLKQADEILPGAADARFGLQTYNHALYDSMHVHVLLYSTIAGISDVRNRNGMCSCSFARELYIWPLNASLLLRARAHL